MPSVEAILPPAHMREIRRDKTLRTWSASDWSASDWSTPDLTSLGLVLFEQLFPRNRLVGDLRKLDQEIDDLFLEDRRAQAGQRAGIIAIIVPDLLFLAGHLPGPLHHRRGQLFVGHLDIVLLADFGNDQAEPHAPLGDAAIFLARLLLGGALVGKGAALRLEIAFNGAPDGVEFLLEQARRRLEFVHFVEPIEQRALELLPRRAGMFARQAVLDAVTQLLKRLQAERLGEVVIDRDG